MEQGTNYLPLLGVGLLMMIIGWALGFFDPNARSAKKIKQAENTARIAVKEAEEKLAQAEQKLAAIAANPVTVDDPGLLRIKNENGSLTLDLDGRRVDTNSLSNDQRKRLIEMLSLVRPWLEGKPVTAPAAPPPPPPAPVVQPKPTAAAYTPSPVPPTPPITQAPRTSTIAKEDRPAAPAGSIVSQIDSILQSRISGTPLEERGVFLAQSPEGGVMVYVGLTKYMGLDEVPDAEIKAAIRAAITEWENKYTPGL